VRSRQKERGFTLIELLVAIGIAMVILAAVTGTFITQSKALYSQEQVNEMQQSARVAIDLMAREIRMAGYNPTDAAFNGVTYSASEMNIKSDLNGDGAIAGAGENVTYTFDAANMTILRNSDGTPQVVAQDVEAFNFQYFDADKNPTTTTADIRQIQISIRARTRNPDPHYSGNNGYRTYQLTSLITPPNLAYE
jgi:type IV pilus assembly protein PilW